MNVIPRPEFAGKRALVTGGTQGIGKDIASRLARQGAKVYLNYARSKGPALETLEEFQALGYDVELAQADMGDAAAVEAMMASIHRHGPIDLLALNAAYQEKKSFLETDLEGVQKSLNINLVGNFLVLQSVAKKLIASGREGRVVISSSGHGTLVFKNTFAYDVCKAGLDHFMRNTALELIDYKIRVNSVAIGWTHTPGERRWVTEEEQNQLSRTIPIGRAARADEIGATLEFLLSDEASYVVGCLFGADGGFSLRPNPET